MKSLRKTDSISLVRESPRMSLRSSRKYGKKRLLKSFTPIKNKSSNFNKMGRIWIKDMMLTTKIILIINKWMLTITTHTLIWIIWGHRWTIKVCNNIRGFNKAINLLLHPYLNLVSEKNRLRETTVQTVVVTLESSRDKGQVKITMTEIVKTRVTMKRKKTRRKNLTLMRLFLSGNSQHLWSHKDYNNRPVCRNRLRSVWY